MSATTRLTAWKRADPGQPENDTDAASSPYGTPAALATAAKYSLCVTDSTTAIAPPDDSPVT